MIIQFNPTGTHLHKGKLKVRLDFYPSKGDKTWLDYPGVIEGSNPASLAEYRSWQKSHPHNQHIFVPVFPSGGYTGEKNARGELVLVNEYLEWLANLPYIWRTNPCLCKFVTVPENVKLANLQEFIKKSFDKKVLANIDEVMSLPDSIHRLHWLNEIQMSNSTIYSTDVEDLVLSVNEELKNLRLNLALGSQPDIIEPQSIDIGGGATDRANGGAAGYSRIDTNNTSNDTGLLTSMEFWFESSATGVKAGTAYGTAPSFTVRDYETIGSVTGGSKQTFSSLSCSVNSGDSFALYNSAGLISYDTGGSLYYYDLGDYFSSSHSYSISGNYTSSVYGTGLETDATYVLGASDSIKGSDSTSKAMKANMSVSDSLSNSDSSSKDMEASVSSSEAIKLSDSSAAALAYLLLLAEGLAIGDIPSGEMHTNSQVSDTLKLSDLSIAELKAYLTAVDLAQYSDSPSSTMKASVLAIDTIKISDNALLEMLTNLSISDNIKISDVPLLAMLAYIQRTEGLVLTDSPLANMVAQVQSSEAITLTDTILEEMKAYLSSTDNLTFSDSLLLLKLGVVLRIVSLVALNRIVKTLIGGA